MNCIRCGREMSFDFSATCAVCKTAEKQTSLLEEQNRLLRNQESRRIREELYQRQMAEQADRLADPEKWAEIDCQQAEEQKRYEREHQRELEAEDEAEEKAARQPGALILVGCLFLASLFAVWFGVHLMVASESSDAFLGVITAVFFGIGLIIFGVRLLNAPGLLVMTIAFVVCGTAFNHLGLWPFTKPATQSPPPTVAPSPTPSVEARTENPSSVIETKPAVQGDRAPLQTNQLRYEDLSSVGGESGRYSVIGLTGTQADRIWGKVLKQETNPLSGLVRYYVQKDGMAAELEIYSGTVCFALFINWNDGNATSVRLDESRILKILRDNAAGGQWMKTVETRFPGWARSDGQAIAEKSPDGALRIRTTEWTRICEARSSGR